MKILELPLLTILYKADVEITRKISKRSHMFLCAHTDASTHFYMHRITDTESQRSTEI